MGSGIRSEVELNPTNSGSVLEILVASDWASEECTQEPDYVWG